MKNIKKKGGRVGWLVSGARGAGDEAGEEEEDVPFPGIRHHDLTSSAPASPSSSSSSSSSACMSQSPPPFPGVRFHLPSSPPFPQPHPPGPSLENEERSDDHHQTKVQTKPLFAQARPQQYLLSTRGGSSSNIGFRATMEDAHAVHDRMGSPWRDLRKRGPPITEFPNECVSFYAVCDGHAGKTAANVCADILPLKVAQTTAFQEGHFQQALKEGFKLADEVILATPPPGLAALPSEPPSTPSPRQSLETEAEEGSVDIVKATENDSLSPGPRRMLKKSNDGRLNIGQLKELKSMEQVGGTCVVACLVVGHRIFIANVGDCEAVLARWQPETEQYQGVVLTEKHRVNEPREKERIDKLGGTIIFGRLFGDLSVTRALGDKEYKKPVQTEDFVSCDPHISSLRLRPNDEFIVMGCDGLWDHVAYDTAIEIVSGLKKAGKSAEEAAEELVKEALEQHSTDNITCVVVYFEWQRTERPPSRIYIRSNSSTSLPKSRSSTTTPARVPTSPTGNWVRSMPRGMGTQPVLRQADRGEATLWRNKSSLGLKAAYLNGSNGHPPSSPLGKLKSTIGDKRRVSVVVNWSSLNEADLEELEEEGWILDEVKPSSSSEASEGEPDASHPKVDSTDHPMISEREEETKEGEEEEEEKEPEDEGEGKAS